MTPKDDHLNKYQWSTYNGLTNHSLNRNNL